VIRFTSKGDFSKTEKFLKSYKALDFRKILERFANEGVQALVVATPKDSGLTADSWGYEIEQKRNRIRIFWTNKHLVDGIPIAILIQYGHGTRSGSFVEGRDFINPAMRPIFDKIAAEVWKEVSNL
jgi:hypothetical protein